MTLMRSPGYRFRRHSCDLTPPSDGLLFPPCGVDDLAHSLRPVAEGGLLERKGTVETVSSVERDGRPVFRDLRWGVYAVFEAPNDYAAGCFRQYGMNTDASGRYSAMYKPFHLIGMELNVSILSAALLGQATGETRAFSGDVVAVAKRDLKAGEILDGEGGYCVAGQLRPTRLSVPSRSLPLGLTGEARMIRDVAAELLEIYARREARVGYKYQIERDPYDAFTQAFPFEETPDQQGAIEAVIEDMQKPQPMDRLICGDVGFGKTEVAMRAAFVAINNGKQVGVLVPTTLLAQQHYQTFSDRFADWAITVEQLSRFRSTKEVTNVQQGLSSGRIDVVIGTHKLLSSDIKFKNLGLLIIDEEHRFGVRQKEKIKALRSEVDILTLTATPIPRTLNLALSGTRELSIIATPPSKRLAIKTFLREWSDVLLREAIAREISRGGQVYFVHNDVETIEKTTAELEKIVPEARIAFAHGQMREKHLESVMLDFYHRRYNVLVCTTIIETGIDVPNANTIIINRADKFGLAQLYQLRGRVGRSHHRACCRRCARLECARALRRACEASPNPERDSHDHKRNRTAGSLPGRSRFR